MEKGPLILNFPVYGIFYCHVWFPEGIYCFVAPPFPLKCTKCPFCLRIHPLDMAGVKAVAQGPIVTPWFDHVCMFDHHVWMFDQSPSKHIKTFKNHILNKYVYCLKGTNPPETRLVLRSPRTNKTPDCKGPGLSEYNYFRIHLPMNHVGLALYHSVRKELWKPNLPSRAG